MPTIEDVLAYLGIDYQDDITTRNANRALAAAIKTLHGAVGEDVEKLLPGDARAKEIVLMFADDLYSQRGTSAKVSAATRQLVSDMIMQLQMELRTKREEAAKV